MGRRRQVTNPVPTNTASEKVLVSTGQGSLYDQLSYLRTVNTSNDSFIGNAGADDITSYGGRDTINAGGGNDTIRTSGGTAIIDGGAGTDHASVDLTHRTAAITVTGELGSGRTATFSDGTVIANVESVFLQLGSGDDVVTFSGSGLAPNALSLSGGRGNDRLTVSSGSAELNGGAGADTLTSGFGNDWLIGGEGDDVLSAGTGNDRLQGDAGTDRLDAGAGDDFLLGGDGADSLTGGSGADRFHISAGFGTGIDRVLDFNFAEGDRISAAFMFFDPESVDGGQPDTVAAATVTDAIGQGFLRVTQTAEGVFVALVSDPASGLLLVGTNLNDFSSDWLV